MKNASIIITIALTFIISVNKIYSQEDNKSKKGNSVKKGDFIIDAYYGYPFVTGAYVKAVFQSENNNGNFYSIESVKNRNHLGGKFEYLISDVIGVGIEYSLASVVVKYKDDKSFFINNQTTTQTYNYRASLNKHRILAKLNFHFNTTEKRDPYAVIGFGFKSSVLKTNNIEDKPAVYAFNAGLSNLFPISIRFGIGMRYFFTKNIGISAEAGIGGPLIQGGICGKF